MQSHEQSIFKFRMQCRFFLAIPCKYKHINKYIHTCVSYKYSCVHSLQISSYIVFSGCHPRNTLIQNICWQCAVFIGFSLMRVCPPRLGSVCGVVSPKCRLEYATTHKPCRESHHFCSNRIFVNLAPSLLHTFLCFQLVLYWILKQQQNIERNVFSNLKLFHCVFLPTCKVLPQY